MEPVEKSWRNSNNSKSMMCSKQSDDDMPNNVSSNGNNTSRKTRLSGGGTVNTTNSSSRLYLAPQPAIRRIDSTTGVSTDKSGNARRRRQSNTNNMLTKSPGCGSYASSSRNRSNNKVSRSRRQNNDCVIDSDDDDEEETSHSFLEQLEAPKLWMDEESQLMIEKGQQQQQQPCWSPIRARTQRHRKRRTQNGSSNHTAASRLHRSCDQFSVHSDSEDGTSVHTHRTHHSMFEQGYNNNHDNNDGISSHHSNSKRVSSNSSKLAMYHRRWDRYWNGTTPTRKNSSANVMVWSTSTTMNHSNNSSNTKTNLLYRYKYTIIQIIIVIIFFYIIFDSHTKVREHKKQLQLYDEERAHILEQMTWIDAAAKKVHKKYSGYESLLNNNDNTDTIEQLKDDNKQLQNELEQIQLRVQQNARDRTVRKFGDNPVQISLPILENNVMLGIDEDEDNNNNNEEDEEEEEESSISHLKILMSDDTPHAVSTLIQQIDRHLWDTVNLQKLQHGRIIQVSSSNVIDNDATPILEFIESSRGCHETGSVALHQLESINFHILVIKVHMEENVPLQENDICIGTVISGLDILEQMTPLIPTIHTQEEEEEIIKLAEYKQKKQQQQNLHDNNIDDTTTIINTDEIDSTE